MNEEALLQYITRGIRLLVEKWKQDRDLAERELDQALLDLRIARAQNDAKVAEKP